MPRNGSADRRSFWSRSRDWPAAGQIGFAAVIGLVVAVVVGVVTSPGSSKNSSTAATSLAPNASTFANTQPTTTTTQPEPTSRKTAATSAPTTPTTVVVSTGSQLAALTIAAPSHQDAYSRVADFGGWRDVHGCRDSRATLLIRTSQVPVTFTTSSDCTVKTGRWVDPWSGAVTAVAHDLQIDHTVPLGNAWRSGAWAWTPEQRVVYANDLTDTDHLVPILAHENESKSDDGPDVWRPPSQTAWCRYALDWDRIKAKWHLTATPAEWGALRQMSATC